ncbi:MAG: YggS family pyridoxal phosphate-dependent enzyme [Oligoflexia bacterium]|nr:YggS family pyridoxal phosphate-dependent enzyme [Oligoflexia bacterium]
MRIDDNFNKSDKSTIAQRLLEINNAIKNYQAKLIAVSKTFPIESIEEAYNFGHRDFGESKVQELQEKSKYFIDKGISDINWHFIGHIQSNKLKNLLQIPSLKFIHSIDSLSLLKKVNEYKNLIKEKELGIFLQVNTSAEKEKSGIESYSELLNIAKIARDLLANSDSDSDFFGKTIKWIGLMTMGPIRTNDFLLDTEESFKKLFEYKTKLENDLKITDLLLAMGMSQDYELALKYRTNFVRIGSFIFGER